MFVVNDDLSIYITRGDSAYFTVTADDNGTAYQFQPGDVVRLKVYGKKNAENVVLQKDFPVTEATEKVDIILTENDTKIGVIISKPVDYWYEVELNPFTNPQTIIGYDDDGAKIFKLFPEGKDLTTDIVEEDIPVVDEELSLTSDRPVQNQAVTRSIVGLSDKVSSAENIVAKLSNDLDLVRTRMTNLEQGTYVAASAKIAYIELLADNWTGENGLYSQFVAIEGTTEYSKVDLLPSVDQLAIFHNKDIAFVTENNDGVITVYAIGDKPTLNYTIQAQITEVVV